LTCQLIFERIPSVVKEVYQTYTYMPNFTEHWKMIESMCGKIKSAWDELTPETRESFGYRGYMRARNYVICVLKSLTNPELLLLTDDDIKQMLISALEGQIEKLNKGKK